MRCKLASVKMGLLLLCVLAIQESRTLYAQATLPAGLQQMSPDQFAAAIRPMYEQDTFKTLTPNDEDTIKEYGRKLFLQVDISNTQLSYQTIEVLHWACRYGIDEVTIDRTKDALVARLDDWTGKPYAEIRAKVAMMNRVHVPATSMVAEVRRWVQAGGTADQVPAADMRFALARQAFSNVQVANGSFTVEWTGTLTSTQTGAHQFAISPINVNVGFNTRRVKAGMTVTVNGQALLDTMPPKEAINARSRPGSTPWRDSPEPITESNVITLSANQPVSIRVTYSASVVDRLPIATLHAMLSWKTPGSNRFSIVPQANLATAAGGKGLTATYSWTTKGQPQTLTRTDPNIDFAWMNGSLLLTTDTTSQNDNNDRMWQAMTSPSFITATVGPPLKRHPFLEQPNDASIGLTTARRVAFCEILLKNPALLDVMDAKQAVRFFHAFRYGAPDKALEAFGAWANRHPDLLPDFSTDRVWNGDQRFAFGSMAIMTTQQLSTQASTLQSQYLQLPDGRCSLPVAYTLANSYFGRGKLSDWIAVLDTKLADATLVGDVRVNWLLARAHAEEFDSNLTDHYPFYWGVPALDPLLGRKYLDQALKAAQSPAVKVRVTQEIISRQVFRGEFTAAKTALQSITQSLPTDQKTVAAGVQQQLDAFVTASQTAAQNHPAEVRQAHLNELQRRREQAAKRGHTAAVNRYDALIGAATKNK